MGIDMELEVIFRIEDLVTESAGVGEAARKVDAFNVLSRNQKIFYCNAISKRVGVHFFISFHCLTIRFKIPIFTCPHQ
jgi:hypothetical protein